MSTYDRGERISISRVSGKTSVGSHGEAHVQPHRLTKKSSSQIMGRIMRQDTASSDSSEEDDKLHSARDHRTPRKKKKNTQEDTLIDVFLMGNEKENAEKLVMSGYMKFIPDPPGSLDAKGQKKSRKKQLKKLQAMLKEHQMLQTRHAYETKVQEYWKEHAIWPDFWPQMQKHREEYQIFEEEFKSYCTMQGSAVTKADNVVVRSFKTFVVVCVCKVGVRTCPTQDDSPKFMSGEVLSPGQVVIVENVVVIDDMRYLKLSPRSGDGWIFEYKGELEVMAEITGVELGLWWYRVCCTEYVEIRRLPSYTRRGGTGMCLCPEEVCVVGLRGQMYGRSTFLQLYDGRGWVFALKSDMAIAQNQNAAPLVMEECDKATLGEALAALDLDGDGQIDADELEAALERGLGTHKEGTVETGLWQYEVLDTPILCVGNTMNGVVLYPGEKLTVDLRAPAHGEKAKEVSSAHLGKSPEVMTRIWLRLYDERGWLPKTDIRGAPLVKFTGAGNAQKKKAPKVPMPKDQFTAGTA